MPGSVGELASFRSSESNGLGPHFPIASCPACNSNVILKQRRQALQTVAHGTTQINSSNSQNESNRSNGSWFLSCSGYPNCRYAIWFPNEIVHVRLVGDPNSTNGGGIQTCSHCTQYSPVGLSLPFAGPIKLALRFRLHFRLPNGYCQDDERKEFITCLYCDDDTRQALGIRIPNPGSRSYPSSSSPPPTTTTTTTLSSSSNSDVGVLHTPTRSLSTTSMWNMEPTSHSRTITHARSGSLRPSGFDPSICVQSNAQTTRTSNNCDTPNLLSQSNSLAYELDHNAVVVCNCGSQAIQLTVKKAGPNQGRLFYRCGGVTGDTCDFFLWKTQQQTLGSVSSSDPLAFSTQVSNMFPTGPSDYRSFPNPNNDQFQSMSSSSSGVGSSNPSLVVCRCGEPAKLLKVTRPTANQGREFYTCPHGRPGNDNGPNASCNFFQWADDSNTPQRPSTGNNQRHTSRGSTMWSSSGARSNSYDGDTNSSVSVGHVPVWPPPASRNLSVKSRNRAANRSTTSVSRRCGLCGEPGHTRTRCPHISNN